MRGNIEVVLVGTTTTSVVCIELIICIVEDNNNFVSRLKNIFVCFYFV